MPASANFPSHPPVGETPPPELEVPHRTTPALLLSLVLHVILLTAIGLFWTRRPQGTSAEEDRPAGIALVHRLPDRDRYEAVESSLAEAESSSQSDSDAASPAAPPADLAPPLDLAGVLKAIESTPQPVSGSGLAGETQLDGDAFDGGRGDPANGDDQQTTTTVFGVSGSGSRFVYVFDRSDSMNGFGGAPLRAAKAELIRSLKTLGERQHFQLIFYNDTPSPMQLSGMPLQMVRGEKAYLALAEQHVRSIAAYGGTEHESALKLALSMGPDVVFFLTDARIPRLSQGELREIQHRAQSVGATIHAIEFGPEPAPPADSFLRQLAAQNQGQYQYFDVRTLSSRSSP